MSEHTIDKKYGLHIIRIENMTLDPLNFFGPLPLSCPPPPIQHTYLKLLPLQ